jgi:DnaJ-domain-containing protein 1
MKNIKQLESLILIKKYKFIEENYKHQKEILDIADSQFLTIVNDIINNEPEYKTLKERIELENDSNNTDDIDIHNTENIYGENNQDDSLDDFDKYNDSSHSSEENMLKEKNSEMKKLYRQIVKLTHPDKVNSKKLNKLYIEATDAYEKDDILTIFKISIDLDIYIELDDTYIMIINEKIEKYNVLIEFLKKTYTYKWFNSNDDNEKNEIIENYIENKKNEYY